jgi:death on curing protein
MIDKDEVIRIHDVLIDEFGGSKGIRDVGLLESAISRPFQTFDNKDLYQSPIDKSSAIFESLIKNHPFVDGNKRTAYVLMRLILLQYDLDITASQEEKYDFVIKAAKGVIDFNGIKSWIDKRVKIK